ncbi:MAG: 1-acyl-sn-glycerol-3-phosphate acyltransferase [Gammaproteobacteria bacterium]|nr:1-acyl-sn-glycerol-3-phosphate acyltransferase [Gammaproteobacteria bacterium]
MLFVLSVVVYAGLALFVVPLPFRHRYRLLTNWADLNLWFCARICRLKYRVEGLENIPNRPSVIMAAHQSTWETLALQQLFAPLAWVIKRELLWIPFFGWGLALIAPIAINRRAGQMASQQLIDKGSARLAQGRWVVVFPQGTRVAFGERPAYKLGGARLAASANVPVIPVAHNAGRYWPRRQFLKYPGIITVRIGPAIQPYGKSPDRISAEVKRWIESAEASL